MSFAGWPGSPPGTPNPAAVLEQWTAMFMLLRGQRGDLAVLENQVGAFEFLGGDFEPNQIPPQWMVLRQDAEIYVYVGGTTLPVREGIRMVSGAMSTEQFGMTGAAVNAFIYQQFIGIYPAINRIVFGQFGLARLNVIGYSQGGATAMMCGAKLVADGVLGSYQYMGFGATKTFAGTIPPFPVTPAIGWIIANDNDPIPTLPPLLSQLWLESVQFPVSLFLQRRVFGHAVPGIVIARDGTFTLRRQDSAVWDEPSIPGFADLAQSHLPPRYSTTIANYYRVNNG